MLSLRMLEGLPCSLTWDADDGFDKVYRGTFHVTCGHESCGFWIMPGPSGFVEGRRIMGPLNVWFPPLWKDLRQPRLTLEFP